MLMPHFKYHRPTTIKEACRIMAELGEKASILAGGTDVIVNMKKEIIAPESLVSLRDIKELRSILVEKGKTRIGACVTADDLIGNKEVQSNFRALAEGADSLGSPLIRNLATIGGNLATARPASDLAPSLMAYGAEVVLSNAKGKKEVPVEELFVGPGKTIIKDDEMIIDIVLTDTPEYSGCAYLKLGIRRALEIGLVNVAVMVSLEKPDGKIKEARVVLGSVAPTPFRAREAEGLLKGAKPGAKLFDKVALKASEESKPIDDFRGSAEYRKEMVKNLTKKAIEKAYKEAIKE